jgi:hypothetical protein
MHIKRHAAERDFAAAATEAQNMLKVVLERVPRDGDLNRVQMIAESLAARLVMSGADTGEICRVLRIRARAIWAMFARAQWTSYETSLGDGVDNVVFKGTGPTSETHVNQWKEGVACAALVGDEYVLDGMSKVPIDILRASSTRHDEHGYLHVDAFQGYLRAERNAPARVIRAMEATKPASLKVDPEYCLSACVAEIELLGLLMIGANFNDALVRALEAHRRYWGNPVHASRALMSTGLFPVNLAALTKLAIVNHGRSVTVTSDYLPADIVAGTCATSG